MSKKLLWIYLLGIFTSLFFYFQIPRPPVILNCDNFNIEKQFVYEVICETTIENPYKYELKNIYLVVPRPTSFQPYQTVSKVNYTRKNLINLKTFDNVYFFNKIAPHQKISIKTGGIFEVNDINYNINDFSQIKSTRKYDDYLLADKHLNFKNDFFLNQVKLIQGKDQNPYILSYKLYEYLIENLEYKQNIAPLTAKEALESKKVTCCDSALLLTALFRSCKIPSRFIGGLFLGRANFKDNEFTFIDYTHAWSWFYIDKTGWIPADPTQGRFNIETKLNCFARQNTDYLILWMDRLPSILVFTDNLNITDKINASFQVKVKLISKKYFINKENVHYIFDIEKTPASLEPKQNIILNLNPLDIENAFNNNDQSFYKYHEYLKNNINAANYNKFIKNIHANSPYWYYLTGLMELKAKNYEMDLHYFSEFEKTGKKSAIIDNCLANIYFNLKDNKKAYYYLKQALKNDPKYPNTYSNITIFLICLEKIDNAELFAKKSAMLFPLDPQINFYYGYCLYLKNKQKEALDYIKIAIDLDPSNGLYWGFLGRIYYDMGENQKSLSCLKKGFQLGYGIEYKNYFVNLENIILRN